MKQALVLLAVAALLATTAGAARPDAPTQRIAETGAPAADAAPAAAAPAATAAAPLLRADQCEPLGQDACKSTQGCVWCRCAAVPSACFTTEQAKKLPPAVFQCEWPSLAAAAKGQ